MPTSLNATSSLADLAVEFPAASRVFRRHGLDYCCHGGRPVAAACAERGLDAESVLAEITVEERNSAAADRWSDRPLPDVVGRIVDWYHARLRTELPLLVEMARKVERRHAEKATCPRGIGAHLADLTRVLVEHLDKEESTLFPVLLAGRGATAGATVHDLEREHEDVALALERTRRLTADLTPPDEACPTWRALYLRLDELEAELMEHVHLENNVLFRRALCA